MMDIAISRDSPFQKILVDDTSRVARDTREALNVFSLVTFHGIHVCYVSQGIDTSHEAAEEMITIHGLVDSMYIRNLARETHRGIEGQVLKGYSGGGRRYGYRSEPVFNGKVDIYGMPEADGYKLKINAEEAETVVRIFKLFSEEGYSAKKIVNVLNEEIKSSGNPKPPVGQYWSVSSLLGSARTGRGILNNEIYIGRYFWNRLKSLRNPESGKKKYVFKDKTKWVLVFKPELQIVDNELWGKVQARRKHVQERTKGRYTKGKILYSTNLLSGLLKCNECGGNMVIVSGGQFARYGCSNNWNKGSSVCSCDIKIKKKELEDTVIQELGLDFKSSEALSYITDKVISLISDKQTKNSPKWQGEALYDQFKTVEKEINNFIRAIKAGIITETVKEKLIESEKKKCELEAKLSQISNSKCPAIPIISTDKIKPYTEKLLGTLCINTMLGKTFISKIISNINVASIGDASKYTMQIQWASKETTERTAS
jgi:DNA invertase Pin-like site-specific DNA recombinase